MVRARFLLTLGLLAALSSSSRADDNIISGGLVATGATTVFSADNSVPPPVGENLVVLSSNAGNDSGSFIAPISTSANFDSTPVSVVPCGLFGCCSTEPNCTSTGSAQPKLLGLIAASDHGFGDFISPMTNPVYFEDPRTLTEARVIFMNQAVPTALGGGNVQLLAMQVRAALTENLSIIATKDGFIWSENPVLADGFADVNAGLKYNLFKDYQSQSLLSTGFTFGTPLGSHQALQGRGAGEFNFFLAGGQQIGSYIHVLSTAGARIPTNTAYQNQSTYWSNHVDLKLAQTGFYLFTEANWYHYLSSANSFGLPVDGLDLFNLGSTGIAGNDVVTGGYGVKYKTNDHMELGLVYEIPYTNRRDILQNRLTLDLILRY